MKKVVIFILLLYMNCGRCQDFFSIVIDTVRYSSMNSCELMDVAIITMSNTTDDDIIIWISECSDKSMADSVLRHHFFFHCCSNRNFNLFSFLTDNGSQMLKNVYIGFSFMKRIKAKESFRMISTINNLDFYISKIVAMRMKDFEKSFLQIKDEWLYNYSIVVLDDLTPAHGMQKGKNNEVE